MLMQSPSLCCGTNPVSKLNGLSYVQERYWITDRTFWSRPTTLAALAQLVITRKAEEGTLIRFGDSLQIGGDNSTLVFQESLFIIRMTLTKIAKQITITYNYALHLVRKTQNGAPSLVRFTLGKRGNWESAIFHSKICPIHWKFSSSAPEKISLASSLLANSNCIALHDR